MPKDTNRSKRDASNEKDAINSSIPRRGYLKAVGSTVGAATLLGSADTVTAEPTNTGTVSGSGYSTTDHGDYIEVTVDAGGQWICSLGDDDTLSNYLVDISASGANAQINPNGSGWTIENVGFRGVSDDVGNMPNKHITPLVPSGGTGTIQNVYMGDGSVADSSKGAIWVNPDHAGELEIHQVYVAGWSDNGIYASAPGNSSTHPSPGAGGTVKIEDSYGENNAISSFRIGTTGSYCDNCVAVGGTRGFWGYYEETDYVDCDSSNAEGNQFRAGAYAHEKGHDAVVNLTGCEAEGQINGGPGTVNGNPGSNPRTSPPNGVPTSAEEAASGSSGGGGGGGSADDRLKIVAGDDASNVSYTFDVYGDVSKVTDNGDNAADSNDEITDNGDGTYTVEGLTGNGYGDTYDVSGNVFSWSSSHTASAYTLYRDGTPVAPDELTTDRFEIVAGDNASEMTYQFTVDGSVSKVTDNGDNAAEDNDDITDNGDGTYTVEGLTGNGYGDTFDFDGTRSDWSSDHDESEYALYTNGSETLPGEIGGGDGGGSTVVDDFEDGDLSEYDFDRGSSGASVASSPTYSGSHALEYAGTVTEAVSTSGLNAYPSAGDTFSFWVRASGGGDNLNVTWGVQDHDNRYYAKLKPSSESFFLFTYENDAGTQKDSELNLSLAQDAWYEIEVQWSTDGTHVVTLYDSSGTQLSQLSMTDSTWTSGGVGYDAYLGSGEAAYFDDVTIK